MLRHTRALITSQYPRTGTARRGPRWGAIVVGMVALTLLVVRHPGQAAVPRPGDPRPGSGGITTRTPYVAPTKNLTAVANSIFLNAKSLSTLVYVAPGLALTQPVTISIAYISGRANRITQTYTPSGNHFFYNDLEGDGKPRLLHMDITLTEPKPGGGIYTFTISSDVWLDPLYDVKIDPPTFYLMNDCGTLSGPHSYVMLRWLPPDRRGYEYGWWTDAQELDFYIYPGKSNTIFEFAWARAEVSASANLHMPLLAFRGSGMDIVPLPTFDPWSELPDPSQAPPLVPGQTRTVTGSVESVLNNCLGTFQYTITYTLRQYTFGW